MLGYGGGKRSFAGCLGKLCVASRLGNVLLAEHYPRLINLDKASRFEFTLNFAIKDRSHPALTSISNERICGANVATGGVK